jgi:release factor glutamine methyltransferase
VTTRALLPPGVRRGGDTGAALRAATARLEAAGLATARQDAEALLARVLGTTRLGVHLDPGRPVPPSAAAALAALVARRAAQEPVQYLLGEVDFAGLTLRLGPGVFIPRPETEELVGRVLAALDGRARRAVDLGTGSGAIACALAAGRPALQVWAVERSIGALAWARENVRRLGLAGRVTPLGGDLFGPLAGRGLEGALDLVVANPPYLAGPTLPGLPAEVRAWEPRGALDGGFDGLAVIARIVAEAPAWLRPGGWLVVEIGADQGPAVRRLVAMDPRYRSATVWRDFTGRERGLRVERA